MKTNCTKKEVGVRGSMKRWALMKLKSWNSLSSSPVLHAKVVSNRCVHVTVTIIISLRSCYNWQQLCGAVVRRLARQRGGGGWQDGGCSGSSRNLRRGACLNLGHPPVYMGLGDRTTPPPQLKTHVLHCVFNWINCPNYVCSTPKKRKELKTNKYTDPMKPGAVGHVPGGGTCHHGRSTSNCFKW